MESARACAGRWDGFGLSTMWTCPECDEENDDPDDSCRNCGYWVGGVAHDPIRGTVPGKERSYVRGFMKGAFGCMGILLVLGVVTSIMGGTPRADLSEIAVLFLLGGALGMVLFRA
ncbi:MAG: hypothetical protein QM796_13605 [Chthoniobacteraceae bacterium]